jgi:predicted anti-sigma-YlaC factor YlaD
MKHPDDLLAEYVDGALSERDRVAVKAHVDGCARCREEVRMGTAARRALASIPLVPVPESVIEEASGATPARPSGSPRWYRWGGVAAAAAIVALVAVTLPSLGSHDNEGVRAEAPADSGAEASLGAASRGAVQLEVATAPIVLGKVVQWVSRYQSGGALTAAGSTAGTFPDAEAAFDVAKNLETTPKPEGTEKALGCLQQAFPGAVQDPVRLIEATYGQRRAYLAITLDDTSGDGRPDVATVWIAATSDCSVISSTQALLPSSDASPSSSP